MAAGQLSWLEEIFTLSMVPLLDNMVQLLDNMVQLLDNMDHLSEKLDQLSVNTDQLLDYLDGPAIGQMK